ncbi:MAG TPA: M56 family metallopeptidase [Mucilaginibacter sp.]|nr:M56 family metallopeptidase [Mucilaginibacter sp.]
MPALFVFLLKVNIALLVFCLGYYTILRRLTFYTLNRIYLGVAIVFSSAYPFLNIDGFARNHQQLTEPVQTVIYRIKAPAESLVEPIINQSTYWYWAEIILCIGAVVFAIRLMVQLISLYRLYKNSKPGNIQDYEVRIVNADVSPFSFWQTIYVNPANLNPDDLKSILQHEQVHVTQWHTLDILLTELSVIFYWFNPGIWLIKKAVRENIEFITDRKILQQGMDSKAYQYSLLSVSFSATTSPIITNHFNFSTLKKRIQMMNAKRSSNMNLTHYAVLVPAVIICLFAVSLSKAELVKNGKAAYKVAYQAVTTSVNNLTSVIKSTPVKPVKVKKQVHEITKADTGKELRDLRIITDVTDVTDTNRKASHKPLVLNDSATYYIDNKRSTRAELNKLDPHSIESFSVLKEDKPDKIILVRTRSGQPVTLTQPIDPKSILDSPKFKVVYLNSTKSDNKIAVIPNVATPKNQLTFTDKNGKTDKFTINAVNVTGFGSNSTDFTGKLILIDDKEATEKEMKKLSVSNIQTITVKKNKIMTDKYGDKAQNGVIFITTKKGK